MECILSTTCSADQAAAMMKNSWRFACKKNSHVRIHPSTSDISVSPSGPLRYVATIEILDSAAAPWGQAEADGVSAVAAVFDNVLP